MQLRRDHPSRPCHVRTLCWLRSRVKKANDGFRRQSERLPVSNKTGTNRKRLLRVSSQVRPCICQIPYSSIAEMFEGQPSHVILAGIGTKHELVRNCPEQRSLFTQYLSKVLIKTASATADTGNIRELRWKRFSRLIGWRRTPLVAMVVTYKELVDKINSEFNTDAK